MSINIKKIYSKEEFKKLLKNNSDSIGSYYMNENGDLYDLYVCCDWEDVPEYIFEQIGTSIGMFSLTRMNLAGDVLGMANDKLLRHNLSKITGANPDDVLSPEMVGYYKGLRAATNYYACTGYSQEVNIETGEGLDK